MTIKAKPRRPLTDSAVRLNSADEDLTPRRGRRRLRNLTVELSQLRRELSEMQAEVESIRGAIAAKTSTMATRDGRTITTRANAYKRSRTESWAARPPQGSPPPQAPPASRPAPVPTSFTYPARGDLQNATGARRTTRAGAAAPLRV